MDVAEDELIRAIQLAYASISLGLLIWVLRGKTGYLNLVVWAFAGYQLVIWYALARADRGMERG